MVKSLRSIAAVVGLLAALSAAPACADDAKPATEARAVISRQLDAFARDDAAGAYELAAPGLKTTFSDPDMFMAMVRGQYAPVYRHRSVEFGDAAVDDDAIAITLTIVDDDNQVWTALYKLARQPDGRLLITGCLLTKSGQKAT